jgi:hypothetical protein
MRHIALQQRKNKICWFHNWRIQANPTRYHNVLTDMEREREKEKEKQKISHEYKCYQGQQASD